MRQKNPKNSRTFRGNTLIQMVLVLPFLVTMSFGGAEYGYYYWVKSCVRSAAAVGARAAVSSSATNTTVTSVISASMQGSGLQSSGYTVTLSPTNMTGLPSGQPITVTVTCAWSTVGIRVLPANLGGISSSKQLTSTVVMNRE